jgi:hypothetical protein
MSLSKVQQKGLNRIALQQWKARRNKFRHLTYSPGEKIWVAIAIVTLVVMWMFALS